MRALREKKRYGICTAALELFPCSWPRRRKKVYGVEIVPQAIEDARRNARLNGMENVEFFVGKAEEVLPEQYEKNQIYADVIVVDPQRKGCDQMCLDTILKNAARTGRLCQLRFRYPGKRSEIPCGWGYEVKKVRGCDMFPQSGHCECVVRLERR